MAITTEMAQKTGSRPLLRIRITTSGATTDITSYLLGGVNIDAEKSRMPDQKSIVSSGDVMLVFSNYNDYFTENAASSVLYNVTYHGYNMDIDAGYIKSDGTTEYADQSILKIIDVYLSSDKSECYILCRDILHKVVGFTLNIPPYAMIPLAGGNTGNGYVTEVQTKPFATVNENWTLTCTLGGGDATATFSVVGSVSGNVGTATSGTEFSNGTTGGVKFTIYGGGTNWVLNDAFTFTTRGYPQFSALNPANIIWALLTGYNYNTDAQESFYNATPKLSHTQGAGNTDINYASFQTAVTNLGTDFNLTGYVNYNKNLAETIQEILLHFLGTMYADENGKIYIKTYAPSYGSVTPTALSSANKISSLNYKKNLDNVVNSCSARYKKTASWAWSLADETTDGIYTATNATSITNYGERSYTFNTYWYSANNNAIKWVVDRIVDRYAEPPLQIELVTGLDALQLYLSDHVLLTDTKTQITTKIMEIFHISKDLSNKPKHINISCDDTGTTGYKWCFLGSSADEGDGISPQNAGYDAASTSDKQFCYLSQTGGENSDPEYYLWILPFILLVSFNFIFVNIF